MPDVPREYQKFFTSKYAKDHFGTSKQNISNKLKLGLSSITKKISLGTKTSKTPRIEKTKHNLNAFSDVAS